MPGIDRMAEAKALPFCGSCDESHFGNHRNIVKALMKAQEI